MHGVNETGKVEIRRKLRRSELIPFFEKQAACTVVMEACGAAHHWARILSGLGHKVKLIAPEAVNLSKFTRAAQEFSVYIASNAAA